MEQEIRAKNLTISDNSRSYIARKLDRLSRHLNNIDQARVELKKESTRSQQDRIVAQVTLNCSGVILRGEERAPTVNAAIDAVAEVLDRRVQRLKGKLYKSEQAKKAGRASSIRDVETPTISEKEDDSLAAEGVARIKRFPMKPMSVDEAAHQMEMLGHDFFFFNVATSEYNVLYCRVNEGYGLLEPELL